MDDEPREDRKAGGLRISPSWVTVGFMALTVFYQFAIASGKVSENTRRIELLETMDRQRGDAIGRIDARTARIEAKIEMMSGGKAYRPLSEHEASTEFAAP